MTINSENGRALCFTGHRPDKLGAAAQNESILRQQLYLKIIEAVKEGYTVFYSGMAMGTDIIAGEQVLSVQHEYPYIQLVAVIPFPGQAHSWSEDWRKRWERLRQDADEMVILYPAYCRGCYHARNHYMINHSDKVLAVYNGTGGGTAETIRAARKKGIPIDIIPVQDCK